MASAKRYFSSTRIAMLALFSALAALLYILNFSLPFFPGFLEFRFSDIPVLIGTFVLGPVSGCIIVVMMVLLKLVIVSTSTFFVGDLADILVGAALVLPVGLVYDRMRTLKGALLGMGLGTLISTALAVFLNRFLLVPAYVALMFEGSWEPILVMMTPLFPDCTQENFYSIYLWAAVLPFNLLRCIVAALVTLLVYKHISRAVNKLNERLRPKKERTEEEEKKRAVVTIAALAAVALVLVGFAILHFFLTQ